MRNERESSAARATATLLAALLGAALVAGCATVNTDDDGGQGRGDGTGTGSGT